MITVEIHETTRERRTWTHRARTDDEGVALDRAVRKHFGARASFFEDHGLPGYGQIGRNLTRRELRGGATWAASMITGRVSVTLTREGTGAPPVDENYLEARRIEEDCDRESLVSESGDVLGGSRS